MTEAAAPLPKPKKALNARRSFWLKQLHQWHWISAALSLIGLLLFAVTGVTLNHAADIPAEPVTVEHTAALPAPLLERLTAFPEDTTDPVPDAVARWASDALKVRIAGRPTETTADEIYVSLPEPGGDGWLTIDRATGEALRERTTRGWIAWLNDLHKGRDTGPVWYWFIDVFAAACIVFAATGFALTWMHARQRPSTWPLLGLGLLVPALIALLFIH
ncbi:PepSY-associated TM helix domain-containing protein [Roseibacterium beibuensis]|uniref:PepSY-associated TM helix domain-containing protein n=1 Tax=[Roseibacterium] beibuensis TaxID=1193142 RepID=UPI00217CCE1F|nr:PepSY-associated TM helix domain-containing protein [Roseibacterium beibuensis]MCS6624457.1 PepSY-associated TM helix domain-containing protein [Roseibacterium beibuensis]